MDLLKISDAELEKLKCHCGQYLSKAPIYIQNGQNVCGDCVDLLAPEPLKAIRNTLSEVLASHLKFPCQFKPQGCCIYTKFNEVSNHELDCTHRVLSCPFNQHSSCDWHGTISQLHGHYQIQHPKLCLASSSVSININEDYEVYYIMKTDDVVFLLYFKCETEKDKLWFNMTCFTAPSNAELINYTMKLSNNNSKNLSITLEEGKPLPFSRMQKESFRNRNISSIMDILQSSKLIECSWVINVTDEFRNKLTKVKLDMYKTDHKITKCLVCGIYTVPPIYRCEKGHVTCLDCRGYYYNCKICGKSNIKSAIATELEEIAKNGLFECKWPNCNAIFSSTEIRQHERICSKRIYTCPECNIWSGLQDQIEFHFKCLHNELAFYVGNKVFTLEERHDIIYFFTYGEFFKLINGHFEVTYCGSPRFVDIWEVNFIVGVGRQYQHNVKFLRGGHNRYFYFDGFVKNDSHQISIKPK